MLKHCSFFKIFTQTLLSTFLISCGGGNGGDQSVSIEEINHPPIVSISGVSRANDGQTIELIALASDPDGDAITEYNWIFPAGYNIDFTQNGNKVSFTTPDITENVEINISIAVKDLSGASTEAIHSLAIIYTAPSYTVTALETINGTVSPSNISVNENTSYTFSVEPAENYEIDSISGCNGALNNGLYTTGLITGECNIQTTFRLLPLSKQVNTQNNELARCLDATTFTTIDEVTHLSCKDVSHFQELSTLVNLSRLTLKGNIGDNVIFPYLPSLTFLYISNTDITAIDISSLTELEELHLPLNKLTELDISSLQKLTTLFIYNNNFNTFDISQNLSLTVFDISGNKLSNLDVSQNTNLIQLMIRSNEISSIDLSNNSALKYFDTGHNKLAEIDLSNNYNLEKVWLNDNQLTNLNLDENVLLNLVWAQDNRIIDVTGIEFILDKEVYFPIYGNNFSIETQNYLENLINNLGYSKLRINE